MSNFVLNQTFTTNLQQFDNEDDPNAANRKQDHIELAFRSQVVSSQLDHRFYYDPLLSAHPVAGSLAPTPFLGKTLRAPIWVSSMTGGTEKALHINHNLARACAEFGMGMGLGSCRSLLYSRERFDDFNLRPIIGDDLPLFGNLGLAQLEELWQNRELDRVGALIELLQLDGLIVHINPLQEWLQPEGDRFKHPPLETLEAVIAAYPELPIIVKEVGQGMGPASLRALFELPLAAIDTAASGGTNFSKLELLRSEGIQHKAYMPLAAIGHAAAEMTDFINEIIADPSATIRCRQLIISGGVSNFLDGYYLTQRVQMPAIYGQASAFLRYAQGDYEDLRTYVRTQIRGLELAQAFLTVR